MGEFNRQLPRIVQQDKEKFTCWAAALESWMSVTPQSPASWMIKDQQDAIGQWGMFTDSKGGLDVKDRFLFLAAVVGMELRLFKPASKISGSQIYSTLKTRGHIYLFFAGGVTYPERPVGTLHSYLWDQQSLEQ